MGKKYLVLCSRYESLYGDMWCLFWGNRDDKAGYTADVRIAHRFTEDDLKTFKNSDDVAIPIDALGVPEEYESRETINSNVHVFVEKDTLRRLGYRVKYSTKKKY